MLKYLVILLFGCGCNAQTIISLRGETNFVKNAYYKDTFNDFDNFVGTWKYTSGTTELTITLHKQASYYNDFSESHEDIVYGEYKYVENRVEKVNTLTALSTVLTDIYAHNIVGNILNTVENFPICTTCPAGQRRLTLAFDDPTRAHIKGLHGRIILRRVDSGGQQKLEMWLKSEGIISVDNNNPPEFNELNVPWGTYLLTKQP